MSGVVAILWKKRYTLLKPDFTENELIVGASTVPDINSMDLVPDIKGRISYTNMPAVDTSSNIPVTQSLIKFFCGTDVEVEEGSFLVEFKDSGEIKTVYKAAGAPAVYTDHQEIVLNRTEWV